MHARGVAIITGAASGIGRATAVRLARDGFQVAVLDRDVEGLDATVSRITSVGAQAFGHELDLLDLAAVDVLFADLVARHGAPSLLVNNAGIGVAATVVDTELDDWQRVVDVNLTAVYRTCRAVLPAMLAAGGGVIVNVASVAGMVGVANRAAYCASKAGVVGLTKAIAVDHAAAGIRVNAICPGTVASEWIGKILADAPDTEQLRGEMEARQLDGRMGTPEEVADGIAFLASPQARFVNGSAFVMDGGLTAR